MNDITLDHIGIAVENLDRALAFYRDVLGLTVREVEEVPGQGVRVAKIETGRTVIELLEPLSEDSPVGSFLAKRGEGVHHICFAVPDAMALAERAREKGVRSLGDSLKEGASGKKVLFFHPKTTHGTLVELAQPPAGAAEK